MSHTEFLLSPILMLMLFSLDPVIWRGRRVANCQRRKELI
jgi:hypothetical protein